MAILKTCRTGTFLVLMVLALLAFRQGVFAEDENTLEEQCALMGCSDAVQRCIVGGANGLMQCRACESQATFESQCKIWCNDTTPPLNSCCTGAQDEGVCRCDAGTGCGIIS